MNTLVTILVYLLVFAAIYLVIEEVLKPSERLKRLMLIILALIVILALLGLLFGHPWFPRFGANFLLPNGHLETRVTEYCNVNVHV